MQKKKIDKMIEMDDITTKKNGNDMCLLYNNSLAKLIYQLMN